MRKHGWILSCVLALLVSVLVAPAIGTTYNYQPTDSDLGDLEHQKAYLWGIQPNIASGEYITGASIKFSSLYNWDNNTNDLFITLIDKKPTNLPVPLGVTVISDNPNDNVFNNYFSSWGTPIHQYHNLNTTPQDRTYTFDSTEVGLLKSFAADNNFGLGLDPDCHYYNCGVKLTVTTASYASLGDYVWHDTNANGIQDASESGISGVTVNLLDSAGNPTGKTTTTNASGYYGFSNLEVGSYKVEFVKPGSYNQFSPLNASGNAATDSDANTTTGKTTTITLTSGQNDLRWDAGMYKYASLGDYVWHDLNANGVQDAGESGISGVTVNLLNSSNAVIGTTTTDGTGKYLFGNLTPGGYAVQFVKPTGYDKFSPQDIGSDTADSDANTTTGNTIQTTLTSGENDLTWDAGVYQYASLGDYVWHDLNANGVQDAGETGISGVTINLLDSAGNPTGKTTTTNASGYYAFDSLIPGSYKIEFVKPTGYDQFSPINASGNAATDSDANTVTGFTSLITLISGQNDLTWDAGVYQFASLGDYVWYDLNNNGLQDAGETGISDVTVNLLDGLGNSLGFTATTDGSGFYQFSNLIPGSYRVEFVLPDGYDGFTLFDIGSNDAIDNNADALGLTSVITLISGQNDLNWDAGLVTSGGGDNPPVAEPTAGILMLGGLSMLLTKRRRK